MIRLLGELITHIRSLVSLLTSDVAAFKENNLAAIEDNNRHKYLINNKLGETVYALQHLPSLLPHSGTLHDKVLHCAGMRSTQENMELKELLEMMTFEFRAYHQMMRFNRQVLNSNLAFIKNVFATLLVNEQEEAQPTYSRMGVLEAL